MYFSKHAIVLLFFLVLSITHHSSFITAIDDIQVETSLGVVVGKRLGKQNVFLGIPYAEPPVGTLRFRPTVPKASWHPRQLLAREFSPECLQSELFSPDVYILKDEDCLYLNIWQPVDTRSNQGLYPVMVWIYGGAFMHGGTTRPEYWGDKLAKKGVIVVSLNYRVGSLGFLVSVSDGLFGNYGLDDQRTALRWIKHNIRAFGGDPNRITLFGESAGAMSIGLHLLDMHTQPTNYTWVKDIKDVATSRKDENRQEQEDPLFHAVIMQSNPIGYKYRNIAVANFIGSAFKELLDCEDLKCLQSESADELLHVQDTLMAVPRSIGDFFTWGPVATDQAYFRELRLRPGSPMIDILVQQPLERLQSLSLLQEESWNKKNVSIILGTTSHEGTIFVYTAFPTRMSKLLFQTILISFFRTTSNLIQQMYQKGIKEIEETTPYPDYRIILAQIIGDYLFRCPNQQFAQLIGASSSHYQQPLQAEGEKGRGGVKNIYLYEFALSTRTPGFACCNGLACHTCEIPFVFNHHDLITQDYVWPLVPSFDHEEEENGNDKDEEDEKEKEKGWLQRLFHKVKTLLPSDQASSSLPLSLSSTLSSSQPATHISAAELMSTYWTNFATFHHPNPDTREKQQQEEDEQDILWWPNVFADLSFRRNNKRMSRVRTKLSKHRHFEDDDDEAMRPIHQLVIDTSSRIDVIEQDCICKTWNTLHYQF